MDYFERVDGLRCLAIGFVLIEHFAPGVGRRISAGYYGVDLFFVLSGFLITGLLLKSRGSFLSAYGRFVGRRTLRIFPLYYLMIAVMLLVGYQPCWYAIAYLATYTYNYAWVKYQLPMGMLTHFWSLAVEEQFYLFWPFLVITLRRRPRVLAVAIAGLAGLCFYQLTTSRFEAVAPYNFVGLFPRAGSLCLGALGALLRRRRGLLDELARNVLLEWGVFAALAATLVLQYDLKYLVLGLCSLYLVLKASHLGFETGIVDRFLTHRWTLHVGRVSYGIYIVHVPIGLWLNDWFVEPWWRGIDFDAWGRLAFLRDGIWVLALPVYSLLSIGLATLANRYVERPILAWKDRLFR